MKMVKSLLLGSAAGIVAVAGAQAADLPVKAKPVEYVKICSLYGAGYWYLPGTDTCLKIGTRVSAAAAYGATNGDGSGPGVGVYAGQLRNDRAETNPLNFYWRAQTTWDFRTASPYGTVRAYFNVGFQQRTPQDTGIYIGPAFIQFAGFTAGRQPGAFDFVNGGLYGFAPLRNNPAGAPVSGTEALTYTAQLGGGFSASISAEDPGAEGAAYGEGVSNYFGPGNGGYGGRGRPVQNIILANPAAGAAAAASIGFGSGAAPFGVSPANPFGFIANPQGTIGTVTNDVGPTQMPDIAANIQYDSPAFSARVMGFLHQINADYYSTSAAAPQAIGAAFPALAPAFLSPACGAANANGPPGAGGVCSYNSHPDDAYGFAVGTGIVLKNAFGIQGDELAAEVRYASGVSGLVDGPSAANIYQSNSKVGIFTNVNDAFYGSTGAFSGTSLNKTSGVSGQLFYQHFWTPTVRGVLQLGGGTYNVGNTNKTLICGGNGAFAGGTVAAVAPGLVQNQSTATLVAGGAPAGATFNCDPNWSDYTIGYRLEWIPMPLLRIGTEYFFNHYNTSFKGWANLAGQGARPAGVYQISDQNTNQITFFIRKELLYP